jgi:glycyl-tRNA synthetase
MNQDGFFVPKGGSMADIMDAVVALAKRRGFVYPSSEIYGGLANSYEYGPMGAELKKNIMDAWWQNFVRARHDMVGLDSSIILHPTVWKASGHVDTFADAMIDCRACQARTRADHLIEDWMAQQGRGEKVEGLSDAELDKIIADNHIPCPECSQFNWTPVRRFNLLFETHIGIVPESQSKAYLRGETAQGIFVTFKNIMDSTRVKLPFGVGQTGKSFRNEITKGNFIFRTMEFEQGEIEYFFDPETDNWEELFAQWKTALWQFVTEVLGIDASKLRWRTHTDEERSFYSKQTEDLEYDFPFGGFKELWGLAYRGDYDLGQHQKFSGQDLRWTDSATGRKFLPHVIEPAVGINRLLLMVMLNAYQEDPAHERVVMRLPANLAPYTAAVFPLLKNKPELVAKAEELFKQCVAQVPTAWDDRGNIGKRYLAQDEIGTPVCITIDFQTLEDGTVTWRDRDTTEQIRLPMSEVPAKLLALRQRRA